MFDVALSACACVCVCVSVCCLCSFCSDCSVVRGVLFAVCGLKFVGIACWLLFVVFACLLFRCCCCCYGVRYWLISLGVH